MKACSILPKIISLPINNEPFVAVKLSPHDRGLIKDSLKQLITTLLSSSGLLSAYRGSEDMIKAVDVLLQDPQLSACLDLFICFQPAYDKKDFFSGELSSFVQKVIVPILKFVDSASDDTREVLKESQSGKSFATCLVFRERDSQGLLLKDEQGRVLPHQISIILHSDADTALQRLDSINVVSEKEKKVICFTRYETNELRLTKKDKDQKEFQILGEAKIRKEFGKIGYISFLQKYHIYKKEEYLISHKKAEPSVLYLSGQSTTCLRMEYETELSEGLEPNQANLPVKKVSDWFGINEEQVSKVKTTEDKEKFKELKQEVKQALKPKEESASSISTDTVPKKKLKL